MDKMSYVRKAVDSYENKGINATVIVENKRTGRDELLYTRSHKPSLTQPYNYNIFVHQHNQ